MDTRRLLLLAIIAGLVCLMTLPSTSLAQSVEEPVVRAVLFFSPSCPHCHIVIKDVLTPLVDQKGHQLQIIAIDTTQPGGQQFYQAAIDYYQIPPERQGVPTLIVDEVVLVGSFEIPQQFPTLVEEGLASGGTDWPDLPGLAAVLPTAPPAEATPTIQPTPIATFVVSSTRAAFPSPTSLLAAVPTVAPSAIPTFTPVPTALTIGSDTLPSSETPEPPPDPLGLTLAGIVLVTLGVSLGYTAWHLTRLRSNLFQLAHSPLNSAKSWIIPVLALIGLGVAVYLAYVEINQIEAICGPVGECNIVQASAYAQVLGIPVAILGVLNYLAIAGLWLGRRCLSDAWANLPALGLLGLSLAGVLFSIYLTWLEIFVIRAVCLWCLSSAVITMLLLLLVISGSIPSQLQPAGQKLSSQG